MKRFYEEKEERMRERQKCAAYTRDAFLNGITKGMLYTSMTALGIGFLSSGLTLENIVVGSVAVGGSVLGMAMNLVDALDNNTTELNR